jgi:hypothetical protein
MKGCPGISPGHFLSSEKTLMLESILQFLSSNKTIVVGATACLAEVATIIVNFTRKIRSDKQKVQTLDAGKKQSFTKKLLWSANPINLFRSP